MRICSHSRVTVWAVCYFIYLRQNNYNTAKVPFSGKNVLNQAHDELTKKGYIKDHRWDVIKGEKGDWKILYWPGALADKFSALHVPGKAIHWLANTDGDTPPPAVKQLEVKSSPSLFDIIGSGVQLKEEGKGQQVEGADYKEHQESIERSIEFYVTEFQKRYGNKPLIVKNRDHAIIRELITNGYSEKDIRSLLRLFLLETENEYVTKSGYTLPVFKTVINTFVITLNMKRKDQEAAEQKRRERQEFEEFKKAKD